MKFIDEAKVEVWAGDGGNGCVSFRREKYVPMGGPNGGDGGNGGSVIIRTDKSCHTLMDVRYKRHFKAGRGEHGKGKEMYGRAGEDVIILLPIGTVVYDEATGLAIADLTEDGQELVVAQGGKGGRGNVHFKTSTHQAPREWEPGTEGEHRILKLELKLLADVGLVGLPNAGKSTLISSISNARPKVADYPFTTLTPNLGVVELDMHRQFTVADIPGLVEGAHQGIGLGIQFLKHIERTKVVIHLVDISGQVPGDPMENYQVIRREMEKYSRHLSEGNEIIALTKVDAVVDDDYLADIEKQFRAIRNDVFVISAVGRQGLTPLLNRVWDVIAAG